MDPEEQKISRGILLSETRGISNEYGGDSTREDLARIDSSSPATETPPAKKPKRESPCPESNGIANAESSSKPSSTVGNDAAPSVDFPPEAGGTQPDSQGRDEIVSLYISLEPISTKVPQIPKLTEFEVKQLEAVLEFKNSSEWRDDWMGNLAFADLDVGNPAISSKSRDKQHTFRQPLIQWAHNDQSNAKYVWFLICHVYNIPSIPPAARKILGAVDLRSSVNMEKTLRRVMYDPEVLREDGWTTAKSNEYIGATGGPHNIGEQIYWDGSNAVVIAYIHDPDIGDLWKAIWAGNDDDDDVLTTTFDLEAEELLEAKRKWQRRQSSRSGGGLSSSRHPKKSNVSDDFNVAGVELGIVLGASYSKGARNGVYWPARVMHASEKMGTKSQTKRQSSKNKIDLVFLAPYWNSLEQSFAARKVEALSENRKSSFHSNPLFQFETVEATDDMIKEYLYRPECELDLQQLRLSFRFTGLPKGAFSRFVDAHRLALGLQNYAVRHLKKNVSATDRATAGLFEAHPLAVRAPIYPSIVLELPFAFILSQLPTLSSQSGFEHERHEPVLELKTIVDSMKPPSCWGKNIIAALPTSADEGRNIHEGTGDITPWKITTMSNGKSSKNREYEIGHFLSGLLALQQAFDDHTSSPAVLGVIHEFDNLLVLVSQKNITTAGTESERTSRLKDLVRNWAILKGHGEEGLSIEKSSGESLVVSEWHRATERLFKYIVESFSASISRRGISTVFTDTRCNGHITSNDCFERAVRLPAALKGAKLAGAGSDENCRLISAVDESYLKYVEHTLLPKAHDSAYLKRMRGRCAAAVNETEILVLTEDSEGNGGSDTHGSKGTWAAAVTAVAAAVAAADMIVGGESTNAFCATRPPGHHAGKGLHPMKAVSNGFCVLNAVACAAIHATSSILEGGLGLKRVCIIDFDVHHGNGTQDILCSTFNPHFLYVSIHAGGPHVNGVAIDDDPDHELHELASNPKQGGGIYPGRCGDTSPHKGVLNIPLGSKVTAHAVGAALLSTVTPAVNKFTPDLIILSAGFDAHKSDPMCLGSLNAEDFGHITEVCCQLAYKSCSGRVLSVLEGGYGVPCCRPQKNVFIPSPGRGDREIESISQKQKDGPELPPSTPSALQIPRPQPSRLLQLGDDLPESMDDQVPFALQRRLEKCHAEGFVECVKEHVASLMRCNKRT